MKQVSSHSARTIAVRASTGRHLARQTLLAAAVFAVPALCAGVLAAQTAPAPGKPASAPVKLDPVVVVASRSPESLATVSPSAGYISAEELASTGKYNLVDVLREQPGFYTSSSGAIGAQTSLFTRGTNSNMTAVLLDGRRLNSGFSGGYDLANYGTDNLASVQFMRGASSTLYGASAVGGVIDMRTVDPFEVDAPTASFSGEGGSYGFWRTALSAAGNFTHSEDAKSGVGFSLGGSWTQTDNKRPNNQYHLGYILPRFDYRVNENLTFNLLTRYSDYHMGLPGPTVNAWTPGYPGYNAVDWQGGYDWLVSPGAKFKINDELQVQAFYSFTRTLVEAYSANPGNSRYEQDKHEATVFASWRVASFVTLSGGYTFEHTLYSSRNVWSPYNDGWNSNSLWLGAQFTPVEGLKINGGVRYNHFDNFDDAWTGEASISYRIRPSGTTLHTKVASAYRTPSANDMSGGTVNNQTLSPEENLSWEFGLKQDIPLLEGGEFSVVYFENHLRDLIDFQSNPATYAYEAFNIEKARTRGVELGLTLRPIKQIRLYTTAAHLDARSLSDIPDSMIRDGDHLRRRPNWTATVGIESNPIESVTVGFSVTYVHGRQDFDWDNNRLVSLKNYSYARFYASWRFWEHGEVFGRIENLFDQKYEGAALHYPALPITAYAGVRFSF
ncbi:MAG: TonB-dependent receptor [Puniceicoccales bacterium]|jgi:vitamin B12 transporter|nr:TonB-dependent receptor [Puniceicoccales bacterium]